MNQPTKEKYKPLERIVLQENKLELPKSYTKICCPSCNSEIPVDDINLQNKLAKCQPCNVVFSITEDVDQLHIERDIKQEVIRPEGIELFYFKNNLDITVPQNTSPLDIIGLSIFPPFALLTGAIYLFKGTISGIVPLILTLLATFFIYRIINQKNHKTYLSISRRFLEVKSKPKNFNKDRTYDVQEIDQIYYKKSASYPGYFDLFMILNTPAGQKHEKLVMVKTLSKAKYLEQEIELHLDIPDRKVPEAEA